MNSKMSILPYTCVFLDASYGDLLFSASQCVHCTSNRESIIKELEVMWSNPANRNSVLPCLCVRSGFDLYLKVKDYPKGSEIIMSAINIPDMVYIVRHHNLKVVPFDLSIDTAGPKAELLESLITHNTVAILIAHVYGKWNDLDPIIDIAQRRNIDVIEDCAECFCGFERIGNPRSDIALFSFGVIKYATAFGGAIAKVKDKEIYTKMKEMYLKYPIQKHSVYLKKVVKYFLLNVVSTPRILKVGITMTRTFNMDHKKYVIRWLRGFPDRLIERIRERPSSALLATMKRSLTQFNLTDFNSSKIKAEYVRARLPDAVTMVGMQADVNNYWLFPVLMDNPDTIVKILNALGIDAYRGATQLNLLEPEKSDQSDQSPEPPAAHPRMDDLDDNALNRHSTHEAFNRNYPHEARYLIDHVVYLPVNKTTPFHVLDEVCKAVHLAVRISKNGHSPDVRIHAKL